MNDVTPFLWLAEGASDAADLYTSVFEDSERVSDMRGPDDQPMGVTVRVKNLEFTLFNGGPRYQLDDAFSLMVACEDQAEIDFLWEKLTEGGSESKCGWLKDRFGVSWQIVLKGLSGLLGGPDAAGRERAMQAMLGMVKLDIAELQAAYEGTA